MQRDVQHETVVGVFTDRTDAQRAVTELRMAGFRDDQIGLAARDMHAHTAAGVHDDADEHSESYAGEGAAAGVAAGASVGALWGLGILAGMLPAIGPAIAGGTLAAILSSAAAGAAAAGVGGALVGMGIPREDAEFYENEFHSGHVIVTVHPHGDAEQAIDILQRYGAYNHHAAHV